MNIELFYINDGFILGSGSYTRDHPRDKTSQNSRRETSTMQILSPKKMLFIGGGFSTVLNLRYFVEEYLSTEKKNGSRPSMDITILDKNASFGLGIAYGRSTPSLLLLNSPVSSMTISSRGARGNEFLDWLENNEETWKGLLDREPRLNAWRESNKINLARRHYGPIFMPRAVFGLFIKDMFDKTLAKARETSFLNIEVRKAEVLSLTRHSKSSFAKTNSAKRNSAKRNFEASLDDGTTLSADRVILAIGSPSPLRFPQAEGGKGYFSDIYAAGFESLAGAILDGPKGKITELVCIGSNAAFMDVIHYIHNDPRLADKVNITAISRGAKPPYGGITDGERAPYKLNYLEALQTKGCLTAEELMSATEKEIKAAKELGYILEDQYLDLSVRKAIRDIQDTLFWSLLRTEKKIFAERFGGRFEGIMRRTAIESSLEARDFLDQDKLRFVSGNIKDIETSENGFAVIYGNNDGEQILAADVVINGMGAPRLQDSGISLIESLLADQLITVNDSGKGISVNESFEASPGLYVMGPMLSGGTSAGGEYFHHLEDVRAIGAYAPRLSKILGDVIS